MRGLLHHADSRAQFLLLRGKRGDGRVVPPLAGEQRLEVALDVVLRAFTSIDRGGHPLNRVHARVMRLEAEHRVAIDVVDERRVELLLA